jgi:glycosyltransferase involved in cell wall biosynthesis
MLVLKSLDILPWLAGGNILAAIVFGGFVKIAFDFTPFIYGNSPGYNEFSMSLIAGLLDSDLGDDQVILIIRKDQEEHFAFVEKKLKLICINANSVVKRALWQNIFIPFMKGIDFIVFTGDLAPAFVNVPYMVVTHDLNFLPYPENYSFLSLLYRKMIVRRSIVRAAVSVAISSITKEEILHYVNINANVIHNPIRGYSGLEKRPSDQNKKIFLCLSSLAEHKNIPAALVACRRFLQIEPDAEFYFAGNWTPDQFPADPDEKGIKLLGYIDDMTRARVVSESVCILAPSVYEGFGMPYVEAALADKALLCCDIDIAREVVAGYPFYIKSPFDADAIYQAMLELRGENYEPKPKDAAFFEKYQPKFVANRYLTLARNHKKA